jgi:peptidoglycan/LPS O-acetylase OafA/YrhL
MARREYGEFRPSRGCAKSNPPGVIDAKLAAEIHKAKQLGQTEMTSQRENALANTRASKPDRIDYVDAVRVILILLVVAHHSVESYVTASPPEVPLPDPPLVRGGIFLWVNAAFFMGLFFFLGGYFIPGAFDRKGAATFLSDRALRLGVPLVIGTILIVPLAGWSHVALDPGLPPVSYWTYLIQDFFGHSGKPDYWPQSERWPAFNFGHLWFLEHLLIYAVLYAAVRVIMPPDDGKRWREPPSHLAIVAYAVLLAAATFIVRIWYPQNRWIAFLHFIQMEPAHLPQYASLFVIGLFAGPRRWLETMPTRRGLMWLAIGAGLALLVYVLAATAMPTGASAADASRQLRVCTIEAFICTGMCVGLPVLSRELALGGGHIWQALARNVFAIYVFHFPFVLLLQWALIDAPMPKLMRLLLTVIGAILTTFAFTNLIVLRLPFARRIF